MITYAKMSINQSIETAVSIQQSTHSDYNTDICNAIQTHYSLKKKKFIK